MAETKSTSRAGSKLDLNESTVPLLNEEALHEKAETPEKDAIELKEKASTASEGEKDDSNPEKTEGVEEKADDDKKKKKSKADKKKEKEEKKKEEKSSKGHHQRNQSCCVQNLTVGLNILDRDEKHINDTVNLNFEDILAEPDSAHGFDPIWRCAFILFTATRYWLYRVISALLALPLAIVWGLVFSLLTFASIWLATPILRIIEVALYYVRRVWVALVQTTVEPLAMAIGGLLANIKVTHSNAQQQIV